MSQQMNILCCYSCNMYQVHIVKKAKKWQCKICNAKQAYRRIFFQGSGKECRIQVQKLNIMKEYEGQSNSSFEIVSNTRAGNTYDSQPDDFTNQPRLKVPENKWAKYLDTTDEDLFSAVQVSDHETVYEATNDSVQLSSDSTSYGCSQSSHSYYKNDSPQNVSFNSLEVSVNQVEQELHTEIDNKNGSESNDSKGKDLVETGDAKTIFDDNEDFDLSIDF